MVLHLIRAALITSSRSLEEKDGSSSDQDVVGCRVARLGPGETLAKRDDALVFTVPVGAKCRGGQAQIQSSDERSIALTLRIDPALIKVVTRAHVWVKSLTTGEVTSVEELAERAKQDRG